jgi:tRNA threonylcarbamoyladenosine modification (KEOPS) complex Cgi121 subunit
MSYIQEFRKYCEIAGFKDVQIGDLEGFLKAINREELLDVEVQFFDADIVATSQHLYFALLNSLVAFKNGENVSKTLAMETMLYASARRQIQKAMMLLGIKPGTSRVAVLIVEGEPETSQFALAKISSCIGGQRDDSVLELSTMKIEAIKRAFDISEEELETAVKLNSKDRALVNLVIERVALLATQR